MKEAALHTVGLDAEFVDNEMKIMESIVKGVGFTDHQEIPYYKAMEKAFAALERAKNIKKDK